MGAEDALQLFGASHSQAPSDSALLFSITIFAVNGTAGSVELMREIGQLLTGHGI